MKQVYEVQTARYSDVPNTDQQIWKEYHIADHIQKVIDAMRLDLMDDATEVISIRAICPVNRIHE